MLGVVPAALMGGQGTIWLLGTDDVFNHGRALLTLAPPVIADWLGTFTRLDNIIAVENHRAIRLLERWGATVSDEVQMHGGVEFVPFRFERAAIQDCSIAA